MKPIAILFAMQFIACCVLLTGADIAFATENQCAVRSGPTITPVIELYTSEGCSSCPPADRWASSLKGKSVVVQAFHVGYWDHIGWADRFAAPAYTSRQREVASRNKLRSVYTPQAVLDGRDWPKWAGQPGSQESAQASITLRQLASNQFEASVLAVGNLQPPPPWSAYWTITEHGHQSKVAVGENAGKLLKHDFVVRQYTPAGEYTSAAATPQKLTFRSIAATPGYPRQVNLVVFESKSGKTLQAVSLQCAL